MKQKNIIIFHTDQQRFDSLGCNGNKVAKTPNINALAQEGCNFTRHISTNPVCMPSRASLITGMYVPGHGVSSNGIPLWRRDNGCVDENNTISQNLFGMNVPNKIPTIADILNETGYETALFGKLHATPALADISYHFYESYAEWEKPETENVNQPYYGFKHVRSVLGHGEDPCRYNKGHYGRWLRKNHPEVVEQVENGIYDKPEGVTRGDIYPSEVPSELHNSMWIANEVSQYIENQKDYEKPIFLFVGFPDPHHSFVPPEDIAKEFEDVTVPEFAKINNIIGEKPKGVCDTMKILHASQRDIEMAYRYTQASVSLIDKAIGQIVKTLKELNMYEDTIIVFTSDHGDLLGDYEMLCKSDMPFYSLIHLPFIIKPAVGMQMPKQIDAAMSNADVLPTLLNMVKVPVPEHIQGIDIMGDNGENMPMTTCYNLKGKNRNISIFNDIYRYTYVVDTGEEELYNHKTDPNEYENLANKLEYRELCCEMKEKVLNKHLECDTGLFQHYGVW